MAEIWANFSGESPPEKEMEMAWSHPTEAFLYHHQANSDLESLREANERSSTEHLETFARNRDQIHGQESVSAREACTGQEAMERDC